MSIKNRVSKKYVFEILCPCETGEYVGSTVSVSVVTSDEIIEAVAKSYVKPTKNQIIKFGDIKATCKIDHFYIYLLFYYLRCCY